MRNFWTHFKRIDIFLSINVLLLVFFGLAALYSLQINVPNADFKIFKNQLFYAILGLVIFFSFGYFGYNFLGDYYKVFYTLGIIILILVLVIGVNIKGTRGWFNLFGFTFQPVELVKVFLVVFISKLFTKNLGKYSNFSLALISGVYLLPLLGLVVWQPDLGSALVLLGIWLGYVFVLPGKNKAIIISLLGLGAVAIVLILLNLKPYQKDRLLTFINPQRDPLGAGYNVTQSMVAVGSGGLWGRGLSYGSQSALNFLPEREADFIFAVIAEELGFVGAGVLLALFVWLFMGLYLAGIKTRDTFGYFVLVGCLIYLIIQTFVNIGMNIGIVPVVGLPLPLVSAGGSSMLATCLVLGFAHSVIVRNKQLYFS